MRLASSATALRFRISNELGDAPLTDGASVVLLASEEWAAANRQQAGRWLAGAWSDETALGQCVSIAAAIGARNQ